MFTGIVEHVGRIESIEALSDLSRFVIDLGPISEGVGLGDSIAVAGCCLTVTTIDGTRFTFEAIQETLDVTRVGSFAGSECFETVDRMERRPDDPTTGPFAVAMLRLACCSGRGDPAIRARYEQPRYTRELVLFELHGMIQDLRRVRQD